MNEDFTTKWISQLKKGTLSFLVLSILKDGKEYYGYDLINEIKKRTQIDIAEGTLYPLMNRLKKEELVASKWVEQESGIPRKYYTISTLGLHTVNEMKTYWDSLNTTINAI
ncbi:MULTISPECIES: PadR family transcriptional regulator [Flavobacterium]|jgi:PadR family transcriptional regulator PadR|uniref:PadR family transcriptional regulator n=1 Tax=Flavobacterium supellecticarium TaxID=2565924 RepID=A0A4S4A0C6_9FLAO|nr:MULTISPECIES: PadR family transcriptional regulator [Flavobacterium]THF51754.1 PadR family transcriptional regulator [Flavobacterium supellecticarium]HRB70942.1 PadR family transcriptional regulator [Flavobacterium sp.]